MKLKKIKTFVVENPAPYFGKDIGFLLN